MSAPPDLVLADMVMPKMGGRELVRRLRERWPSLRALYMSGYTSDPAEAPDALGPHAMFIDKPFHGDELAAKVREALDMPLASEAAGVPLETVS
jgi:CheY-like chemotaxis protein